MLRLEKLACQRGSRWLFRNLELTVEPGQLIHVQGANGSGKTSLLRILSGLSMPDSGELYWHDRRVKDVREDYLAEMLYLGHTPAVKDDLSVRENLLVACRFAGLEPAPGELRTALETVGLGGRTGLPARVLSQGQRRRLALARLWLDSRPLWILDEPFTALDIHATQLLEARIEAHLSSGGMVVLTTHQKPGLGEHRLRVVSLEVWT